MLDTTATPHGFSCQLPADRDGERVLLAHGGGGLLTQELVEQVFVRAFDNPTLARRGDSAVLEAAPGRLAFTTDGFVVRPLFFPGGSIGDLAVNGTVNDLSMSGAVPRHLTAGFIVEEGMAIADLVRIADAMAAAARAAGVTIVAGDTKVVERGHGDGVYITTSGIGTVPDGLQLGPERVEPGDSVVVSGTIGDHGIAVMSQREGLGFEPQITSDTAALHELVAAVLAACPKVRLFRDPTRGGLATSLVEIAVLARCGIEIDEASIPVAPAVAAVCEMLGLDPMLVANEGKLVAIVAAEEATAAIKAMRSQPLGARATLVGRITAEHRGRVWATTSVGGRRVVPMPVGEQLPRIC